MAEHAQLSPSGAARWLACPGSIKLSERAPAPPDSAAATEGTDAHEYAARQLLGVDTPDCPYEGLELYTQRVLDAARKKGARLWVEERVFLTAAIHGTPDAVVYAAGVLDVFDLKYGYNRVDPAGNPQLLIYAAAAIKSYALKPKKIRVHIVQPRAGGVRTASYTPKTLEALVLPMLAAAERIISGEADTLRAGEHCQYCRAAPICAARSTEAQRAAAIAFTSPDALDEPTLIWAIENKKRITDWFDLMQKHALGAPPTGYTVVRGQGKRVWRTDIEIPSKLAPLTLAEAAKQGYDLDALTVKKEGPPTLVKIDTNPEDFPAL